jgi:hypothetical protein
VAVWSDLDQLIYPKEHAQLHHPNLATRNVLLSGIGHMSLPIDRRVVREVMQTLTHLHADGTAGGPDGVAGPAEAVEDAATARPESAADRDGLPGSGTALGRHRGWRRPPARDAG